MTTSTAQPEGLSSLSAAKYLAVAALIGALMTHFGNQDGELPTITGKIESPSDDAEVSEEVMVRGSLSTEALSDAHLWIAVRKGDVMWPKDPAVEVVDGAWETTIYEGGRGPYSIVVYLVSNEGHQEIQAWVKKGQETGEWPGFTTFKGEALDSVDVHFP